MKKILAIEIYRRNHVNIASSLFSLFMQFLTFKNVLLFSLKIVNSKRKLCQGSKNDKCKYAK
jgi:hypothetical protein